MAKKIEIMKENITTAIRLTLFCAVFFAGFYTLSIYGIAQFAPNQGKGEIVIVNGKNHNINIAQKFVKNKYFWSRPSAVDYNPPIVVGIKHTNNAINEAIVIGAFAYFANGANVTVTMINTNVNPANKIVKAISLGVF